MKFEQPKTPEEINKIHLERLKSDAKLSAGGAEIKFSLDGKIGDVTPTEEQIKDAKIEMGEHFYNESIRLKKEKEEVEDNLREEKNKGLKWWQKEYKGYDIYETEDFDEVEKYMQGLDEDEIKKIRKLGSMRYSHFLLTATPMERKVVRYLVKKERLEKWLEENKEE